MCDLIFPTLILMNYQSYRHKRMVTTVQIKIAINCYRLGELPERNKLLSHIKIIPTGIVRLERHYTIFFTWFYLWLPVGKRLSVCTSYYEIGWKPDFEGELNWPDLFCSQTNMFDFSRQIWKQSGCVNWTLTQLLCLFQTANKKETGARHQLWTGYFFLCN